MNILKNNKGLTVTEIIISISLVSIVLIFLFNALITIKNTNEKVAKASTELINQALVTRSIQNDFKTYELQNVYACDEEDEIKATGTNSIFPNPPADIDNLYCLKFKYNSELTSENVGYLLYYTYKFSDTETINVVGYKRGYYQIMRETNITPKSSEKVGKISNNHCSEGVQNGAQVDSFCTLTIKLPIYDEDGNNYSINLSHVYLTTGRYNMNDNPETIAAYSQMFFPEPDSENHFGFKIIPELK